MDWILSMYMFFCQILWRRILFESLAQLWKFGGQLPYVFLSCADQDFSLFSNRISLQLFPIFLISNSPAMSFVFISCHLLSTNEYQKYKSVELGDQLHLQLIRNVISEKGYSGAKNTWFFQLTLTQNIARIANAVTITLYSRVTM